MIQILEFGDITEKLMWVCDFLGFFEKRLKWSEAAIDMSQWY